MYTYILHEYIFLIVSMYAFRKKYNVYISESLMAFHFILFYLISFY